MANMRTNSLLSERTLQAADTSTPVLLASLATHGPLCIARSLGRMGVRVYGLHAGEPEPAHYSQYVKRVWRWNFPYSSAGAMERLVQVGREIGRRTILLPTSDETAIFVAENQTVLRELFEFPKQSPGLPRTLSDKKQMYFLARKLGIPTPETVFPEGRDDVLRFAADAKFPLMLKAIDGARSARRTGEKMVIVHDLAELLNKYEELEDPGAPNFMLQEYIPGGDDTIWMFNGYFDENSECLYGATGKKIRQQPVNRGFTSLGICLKNDVVDQTTRRFMKTIGYRGILDIGYRWDARDGQYKVLDINPRIGATFRLFAAQNGLDVARALYLDLTGQPVGESSAHEGRKWMVEIADLKSCIEYRRRGELTLREWLRSLRGVEEVSYFAVDDMLPFLVVVFRSAVNALKKLWRKKSALQTAKFRGRALAVDGESRSQV